MLPAMTSKSVHCLNKTTSILHSSIHDGLQAHHTQIQSKPLLVEVARIYDQLISSSRLLTDAGKQFEVLSNSRRPLSGGTRELSGSNSRLPDVPGVTGDVAREAIRRCWHTEQVASLQLGNRTRLSWTDNHHSIYIHHSNNIQPMQTSLQTKCC